MSISFIIPHKGREELLQQTINSVAAQDVDLADVEVIVVTQNQKLSVSSAHPQLNLNVLYQPTSMTISELRNTGATAAQGDYLAFLDADIELSKNWLKAMLQTLQQSEKRVLVSAVQRCDNSAPLLERLRTVLSNAVVDQNVRFLPGRNLFLHKDTFTAAGQFPAHLVTCEDYYFTDKVHSLGELFYSSSANYVHLGEDKKLGEMFKKEIWRGQSNLQSLRDRKIPLEELPSFLVPLWILFFFVASLALMLTDYFSFALVTAGLTILPIVLYSLRLFFLAKKQLPFFSILQFYLVYFPARIIGTLTGLVKAIKI